MSLNTKNKELTVKCPLYSESLSACPSSKSVLFQEDLDTLKEICTNEKYRTCKVYLEKIEKAA